MNPLGVRIRVRGLTLTLTLTLTKRGVLRLARGTAKECCLNTVRVRIRG